jgi:hypothetical protein
MKVKATTYTFSKGTAGVGTITFTGSVIPSTLDQILIIADTTAGVIIYNPFDATKLGTYANPVLTLAADTNSLANTDKLLIFIDDGDFVNATGSSENNIAVELTRPADTTAYAALDAISDSTSAPTVVYTFTNLSRANGKGGYIVKAQIATDQKTCTARFRLHLFDTAPTAINDNSSYLSLYANKAIRLGTIDFAATATEDPTNSTQAIAQSVDIRLKYLPTGSSRTIYGLLETLDAFTPASGQKFYIKLSVDNN